MREVESLRRRISVLSAASLRISASLDLDTVLHEVVDSARTLTGSGYGLIITLDDAGQPQDFITSGISAEEHRRLVEWPDGPRLFEHLRDLPGVLRLADVHVFVRARGFSADLLPSRTFQGTPMRHQGVHVGNFYLVDKEGGKAFSDDDEEILVLFASQAASAIANARTYRAERRARADLEALVDTSPVGVVVFNAKTGALVSLNREATRIVESLHLPGTPPAQLLNEITCRRADGREIALDQLPLSGELAGAETVRVEEVVLSTPDGRSVTTLINATPIRAEDGVVESVVVTMQDLAPLEKMDRMLPGTDGIELMEHTPALADLPVIFISGYRREETIVRALDSGAADYIVKPFSPTELTARIRAALRRWAAPDPFVLGELTIAHDRRRVTLAGRALELTATEYNLLRVLALNAGRVTTYDTLLRQVWGGRNHGDPKLVRAFIKKLRQKLGDDANAPAYIMTERGVGYRMVRPGEV